MADTTAGKPRTDPRKEPADALRALAWPRRLTHAGLVAERVWRAFWPLWTALALVLGFLIFLAPMDIPLELFWVGTVFSVLGTLAALVYGVRVFHWPTRADAEARLDRSVPGRPIETLGDLQAIGAKDVGSRAVWHAHLRRIAEAAKGARAVHPNLRIAERDPYALRYAAACVLATAVLFGGIGRLSDLGEGPLSGNAALATGPSWEGWIEPPAYTGKPTLYLNELIADTVTLPEGSRLTIRLYGTDGALGVRETVSGAETDEPSNAPVQDITARQSGALEITGRGGRAWTLDVTDDLAPSVTIDGAAVRAPTGEMRLPFTAQDDFGVVGGEASIVLDLAAVDRRFGLALEPEPRESLIVPLPLSISGDRRDFSEVLIDDFSKHPWANLPVTIALEVSDDLNQTGAAEPEQMILPGRRFFDPMAKAVVEQRRDLLWSRDNGGRVAQVIQAVTHRPEGFISNDKAYLLLRTALSRLIVGLETDLSSEVRDDVAEMLWEAALQFEEGDLADAAERLRRAQEQLSQAMRDGATDEEIADLMQELREAMQDYMRQLAEQFQRDMENGQQQAEAPPENSQEITGDQLDQMLQRLQELMEQGRMDEAQALLDQMMQMMQNMQMAQGQQGQQGQSPGQQAMEGLQDTLRQQQGLADEAFRDLQQQNGQQQGQQPGQQPGQQGQQQPGQGQPGEQQPGQGQQFGQGNQQPGQGQPMPGQPGNQPGGEVTGESLAQRQEQLRDLLDQQTQNLPGAGTEAGDAAREALDRAGRSMEDAADALGDGDLPEALDNQADAMDALREGMQNLGQAMAEAQQGQPGSDQGQANGGNQQAQRDPLGREAGTVGRLGTDENMLQGEDPYRRARELLDEIRRRSGEQARPDLELEYLKRLLERF